MRGLALVTAILIPFTGLFSKTHTMFAQSEVLASEVLGVTSTAVGFEDLGGIKRIAMEAGDVKFTLSMSDGKYYSDNYDNALLRNKLSEGVEKELNDDYTHSTYVDVYGRIVVAYLLVDETDIQGLPVADVSDMLSTIARSCEGYTPIVYVTTATSDELSKVSQLSEDWYGLAANVDSFYPIVADKATASFVLLGDDFSGDEIRNRLSTLY